MSCMAQVRQMLGDNGRSLVVGVGHNPPRYAAIQSASCPTSPAVCNAATAEFSQDANPQTATGSLIYGNCLLADYVESSRADTSNSAAVSFLSSLSGISGVLCIEISRADQASDRLAHSASDHERQLRVPHRLPHLLTGSLYAGRIQCWLPRSSGWYCPAQFELVSVQDQLWHHCS